MNYTTINKLSRSHVLSFKKVQKSDEGYYLCAGDMEEEYAWSGRKVVFLARAHLKVIGEYVFNTTNYYITQIVK